MREKLLPALAAAALGAGCTPDRNFAPIVEECREAMPTVVYEHACQHGELGPFEKTAAAPSPSLLLAPVGARQRALEVSMPRLEGDEPRLAYLQYRPSRDGQHAIFTGAGGRDVEVVVMRGDSLVPGVLLEHPRTSGSCGGMSEVTGFELSSTETYVFELGPTTAQSVTMFIEHLGSFGAEWSEQCR